MRVSAFATTGMRLTLVPSRFMISMSRGFSLKGGQENKVNGLVLQSTLHDG